MMSVSMSDVGRYVVLMAFRSQASRTKWKRALMCLVHSWNFGFFASWIAPWLSTKICWGSCQNNGRPEMTNQRRRPEMTDRSQYVRR